MDIKKNKGADFSSIIGILVSVVLAYLSAICTLPSSGIVSTLPVTAVTAILASFICKKRSYIYASFAVMPFLATLLLGFDVKRAVIVLILSVASAYFAVLAKRAILTVIKSRNPDAAKKSKSVFAVSVVLTVALWLIGFGNPISFAVSESRNSDFAKDRYADEIELKNTYFDISSFSYLTEISFYGAEAGTHYYISAEKHDDYIDFHVNETILDIKDIFNAKTALPSDCFKCYINQDEFVFGGDKKLSENLKNTEFLIIREEYVPDMDGFKGLYNNLMTYATASDDLLYKSITMTAKGLDGRIYYAYKNYNEDVVFSVDNNELGESIKKFN